MPGLPFCFIKTSGLFAHAAWLCNRACTTCIKTFAGITLKQLYTITCTNYFIKNVFFIFLMFTLPLCYAHAQTDSAVQQLQNLPKKYIGSVENKIDKYSRRISTKTEKTLVKLARWENKIKNLLQKTSPKTAEKLFAAGQTTFSSLLQQYKQGLAITENYKVSYDSYRDELTTQLKYIEEQQTKFLNPKPLNPKLLNDTKQKLTTLEEEVQNSEALQHFIKERKQQLMHEAFKYLGKSKYLQKIGRENFYYIETLKNYKEIFSDKKKAEQTALTLLNKITGFKKFIQENSMLASLFGPPSASGSPLGAGGLSALQTRASVNALIQNQIASGGPGAMQQVQQNFMQAQSELSKLKDKVLKAGGSSSDMEIPDFKKKEVKTKTFKQRLEFGANFQTAKGNSFYPTSADLGVSIGYVINDKSIIGIGASYKLGLGKDISHIQLSSGGAGLRSFVDYKLKKQFWLSGGAEMNYRNKFTHITSLQNFNAWQSSALLGLSKKYKISKKMNGSMQLLYDFLYLRNVPVKQPVIFRVGYGF